MTSPAERHPAIRDVVVALFVGAIWITAVSPPAAASPFYEQVVIGEIGAAQLTDVGLDSSVNDKGQVAFVGFVPDPQGTSASLIFVGDGTTDAVAINPGFLNPNRLFTAPSINDADPPQVFARDRVSGSPPIFLLRLWDTVTPNLFTPIARTSAGMICTGGLNVGRACTGHADCGCFGVPFPFCSPGFCTGPAADPFDGLLSRVAVNLTNQTVFSAFVGVNDFLVTGATPTFEQIPLPIGLRPAMADDGSVVVRAGTMPTDPIRRYDHDLAAFDTVADSARFDALGLSPGISATAAAIAFAGTPSSGGAAELGTGTGIFLSIARGGGSREIVRITGRAIEDPLGRCQGGIRDGLACGSNGECPGGIECQFGGNRNGVCEPAERCVLAPELGRDGDGQPIGFAPAGYDLDTKVDVIHQERGAAGLADDTMVVTLVATPATAAFPTTPFRVAKGLWTTRVDFDAMARARIAPATPVVQLGDQIEGRVIDAITLSEPLARAIVDRDGSLREEQAGDHRVVFAVTSGTHKAVIRADHLDSDGDALLDHWESTGVDFDGNGDPDLTLDGADPRRKDLFVEIDWMAGHEPFDAALAAVMASFANAPVANPDGTAGIAIHLEKGEEATAHDDAITFGGPDTDFDAIKAVSFGTPSEQGDANTLAAKRLTHRYGLFVHTLQDSGCTSGRAELPGNDFVVSLGCLDLGGHPNGGVDEQAATTMHELGHTLELGHGGDQLQVNCKPNYLSVMNYFFQFYEPTVRRPLDYSDEKLPNLDEGNLNEPAGISGPAGLKTFFGPPPLRVADAAGSIDWSRDGDVVDAGVSADVNRRSNAPEDRCNGFNSGEPLTGYDDWQNLRYDFRSTDDFADGVHSTVEVVAEQTIEELIAVSGDFDADGVVDILDNCDEVPNVSQVDDDEDTVGNACDVCPSTFDPGQEDSDHDGVGDVCQEIAPTPTVTAEPPTITPTPAAPTVTATPALPTATSTSEVATPTFTPELPTVTPTPEVPTTTPTPELTTPTSTPEVPTVTPTTDLPTVTTTPLPPTVTVVPPTNTLTPTVATATPTGIGPTAVAGRLELRRARIRERNGGPGEVLVIADLLQVLPMDVVDVVEGVVVRVADGDRLVGTAAWAPNECRTFRSGRIVCKSADRTARLSFTAVRAPASARLKLYLRASELVGPFVAPLTLELDERTTRRGTIDDCRTTAHGIQCSAR